MLKDEKYIILTILTTKPTKELNFLISNISFFTLDYRNHAFKISLLSSFLYYYTHNHNKVLKLTDKRAKQLLIYVKIAEICDTPLSTTNIWMISEFYQQKL